MSQTHPDGLNAYQGVFSSIQNNTCTIHSPSELVSDMKCDFAFYTVDQVSSFREKPEIIYIRYLRYSILVELFCIYNGNRLFKKESRIKIFHPLGITNKF